MNLVLAVMLLVSAAPDRLPVERVVRIDVPNHDAVYSLAREYDLAVIDARDRFVDAYADDDLIATLRNAGYKVTVLVEDYTAVDFVTYNTYAQACSILAALRAAYPAITHVETLGLSAGNRPIPAILVTDNPEVEEGEPVCRAIGTHHGNEKQGTEICLSLAQYLCDNYATNSRVRALVDSREFWVVPILNPDGHVANRRTNDGGVDINRDYGYEWENSSYNFSQPEPRALRALAERHYPTAEYEFHTTAAYVNYLWDNHPSDPPDSAWIIAMANAYADSTYGSNTTQLEPINGYDWYEVHGSCQDYMFGVYGCQSVTIETALPSTRPRIDSICEANRRGMFGTFTLAGKGINGVVTDSASGAPLFARVDVTSPQRFTTWANAAAGDFHKMVAPGTYTIRVTANGYAPKTVCQFVVPDTGIDLAVRLQYTGFDSLNWAQRLATLRRNDDGHIYSDWITRVFGAPDGSFYTVGPSPSEFVLDLDPAVRCRNTAGPDLSVYATGTYTLYAGNDFRGPWYSLGPGSGNASFDLATPALDSCCYVRLVSSGTCAVDAVGFRGSPTTAVAEKPTPNASRFTPNATIVRGVLHLPVSSFGFRNSSLVDAAGRRLLDLSPGPNDVSSLSPGVYFVRQASGVSREAAAVSRVVIAR